MLLPVAAGGMPDIHAALHAPSESLGRGLQSVFGPSFLKGNPITETVHVFLLALVVLVVLGLAFMARNKFKAKVDEKLTVRTFFELIFDGLMNMMEGLMGRKNAERFLPLIGTLALYIFFSNILALVPGMVPPTDNLNTTVAPAVIVFLTTHYVGFKDQGPVDYFKHFLGPITKWYALPLMLLIFLIEVVGHLARPLSLSLRLFGNMYADHSVLGQFVDKMPFLVPVPNLLLGCVVVVVQTLVFCLLSIIYISLALPHDDHAH